MITKYVAAALARARYAASDRGSLVATVPGLRGVIAHGATFETCRSQLAEVIEAWILVRVSRGLSIPKLGGVVVRVTRVSNGRVRTTSRRTP